MPKQGQRSSVPTPLSDLATTIKTEVELAESKGLEHYRTAGQALCEAKKQLGHGNWLPWLKKNCPEINERRARRYIALAKTDVTSDLPEQQRKVMGNAKRPQAPAVEDNDEDFETGHQQHGDRVADDGVEPVKLQFDDMADLKTYRSLVDQLRLALDKSSDEATILHALTVCGSHTAT